MRPPLGWTLAAAAIGLAACGAATGGGAAASAPAGSAVNFQASGLEHLAQGHYEGWVISGNQKLSFGTFNVDTAGRPVSLSGGAIKGFRTKARVSSADAFAVTVEPDGKSGDQPSPSVILLGKTTGGKADLSFQAIEVSSLAGGYILAAPTGAAGTPQTAGVWFLDLKAGKPVAGLRLPAAPAGWKYEGWIVFSGQPLSTGRFSKPDGADESARYSSTQNPAPPFPGEDFLQNLPAGLTPPLNLAQGSTKVVLTIEPDVNGSDPTGDGPFFLKPLSATIAAGAKDHTFFNLTLSTAGLPTGSASLG
ncbi:MAG TPA: anti-sigma factor [Candidatus Acidoferrales bacterium]|nr:anti-sigma factor [Candidatus Acidoferrales bacterium]